MNEIKYLGSALYDLKDAKRIIFDYFEYREISNLTQKHINKFLSELKDKVNILRDNPEIFQVRKDGVFQHTEENWRCFTAHWFTVFYTHQESTVYIWYIKPTKSDVTTFLY
jgi:plasmid stabilization system protein ParE